MASIDITIEAAHVQTSDMHVVSGLRAHYPSAPRLVQTGRQLARAYRATMDGWSALSFHRRCDMKGPVVIIAETVDGHKFGGFNPEGFKSSDDYAASYRAFLLCWPDARKRDDVIVLGKVLGRNPVALVGWHIFAVGKV